MNYRANYKYHVMNTSNGKLTFSTNDHTEALDKAKTYCQNSGHQYVILEAVTIVRATKSIETEGV